MTKLEQRADAPPIDLDRRIDALYRLHNPPGLAVGIVRGGELVHFRGLGWADVAARRPITQDTVFRIGSISKTMTAIAVLQLRDAGHFALDDALNEHLRKTRILAPDGAPPVTIRHALTHTAGVGEVRRLRDLRPPTYDVGIKQGRRVPSPNEHYAGGLRAVVPAGERWAYANHVYGLLGQLVEDVSGEPYDAYLREHVFAPLGMNSTDAVRSAAVAAQLATGYRVKATRRKDAPDLDIIPRAAGSVYASFADMVRYAAMVLGGGANAHGRVLSAESFAEMTRPHWQLDPRLPFGQGLGFLLDRVGGHRVVWHDGGWIGFISSLLVAPDDDVAVLAFENGMTPVHDVSSALLRQVLGQHPLEQDLPSPPLPDPGADADSVVGSYRPRPGLLVNIRPLQLFGGEVAVERVDDALQLRALAGPLRQPVRLYRVDPDDPDRYRGIALRHGAPVAVDAVFVRDGGHVELRLSALLPSTLVRVPRLRSWRLRLRVGGALGVAALAASRVARGRRRPR